MSSKKTIVAIAITTAALTVGSVGFANASPKSTARVSTTKTTARISGITNPITAMKGGPVSAVTAVLAALVTKGTITQAQADAILPQLLQHKLLSVVLKDHLRVDQRRFLMQTVQQWRN